MFAPWESRRRYWTFSRRRNSGRFFSVNRNTSFTSPERAPFRPERVPARLRSWHGNPAAIRSTAGRDFSEEMSWWIGVSGKLVLRTAMAAGSISHRSSVVCRSDEGQLQFRQYRRIVLRLRVYVCLMVSFFLPMKFVVVCLV